jgi:hypothetical protein
MKDDADRGCENRPTVKRDAERRQIALVASHTEDAVHFPRGWPSDRDVQRFPRGEVPPTSEVSPVRAAPQILGSCLAALAGAILTAPPSYAAPPSPGNDATDDARLQAVLPAGMSSQQACLGFTSLDLCAATLHAARNLGIPYTTLKGKVTAGEGLDAAIHALKPEADASAEATHAKEQAHQDMRAQGGNDSG